MEQDYISRRRLRRKVLDRWENEGGRLCADPQEIVRKFQGAKEKCKDQYAQISNDDEHIENEVTAVSLSAMPADHVNVRCLSRPFKYVLQDKGFIVLLVPGRV